MTGRAPITPDAVEAARETPGFFPGGADTPPPPLLITDGAQTFRTQESGKMPDQTEDAQKSITDIVDAFLAEQRALADGDEMTFTASVRAFIADADWITHQHMPAVVLLHRIATQLDRELTAALAAQFGVTFRDLRSQAPGKAEEEDPIEKALRERGEG